MPRTATKKQAISTGPAIDPLDFDRPFQQLRPETFYRFTREYPNKEAVSTYVYRLLPKINRSQVGIKTNYIAIHTEPIDEAFLLEKHGSGFYMLKFTDSNQPKGLAQRATTKLELSDPDFPPVVDPRELVLDDEKSRPWLDDLRARGILKGDAVSGATNESPAVEALADVTRKLLEARGEHGGFDKQITPIILKLLDQKPSTIDDAVKLASLMKPAESPVTAELLKMLLSQQRQSPADPFEAYERVEKVVERIAAKNGGGRTGGWSEFMQTLPSLIQGGLSVLSMMMAMRTGQPAPPISAVAPAAPIATQETALPTGESDMLNPAIIRALQTTGERAIKAFERGISGDHFASALCIDDEGERIFAMLHQMGKDGIFQALSMAPGVMDRIAPRRAEIEVWLDDFIKYGSDDGETA
jgi:hypothetical protein